MLKLPELTEAEARRAILSARLNRWTREHREEAIALILKYGVPRAREDYNPGDQVIAWLVKEQGLWKVQVYQQYWKEWGDEYYCRATFTSEDLGLGNIN